MLSGPPTGDALTIAACYLSPEGAVLGADSTTTYGTRHYNNSQKVFEIGDHTTLGVVTWGLGGLQVKSYRTLFALLGDELAAKPASTVEEVVDRWIDLFWTAYQDKSSPIAVLIQDCQALHAKANRSAQEQETYEYWSQALVAGFCIAGYLPPNREPKAFEILFDPLQGKPKHSAIPLGYRFWGAPLMIQRLIFAADEELKQAIVSSGKWTGTRAELDTLVSQFQLGQPLLPMRDAIDFIHACVSSTIKAFKFAAVPLSSQSLRLIEVSVGSGTNHGTRPLQKRRQTMGSTFKQGSSPMQESKAELVSRMRDQFSKTGSYRAEDVQRILGDPRQSVGMETDPKTLLAAPIKR